MRFIVGPEKLYGFHYFLFRSVLRVGQRDLAPDTLLAVIFPVFQNKQKIILYVENAFFFFLGNISLVKF
jgi:hypothetical protein